jgi:hypothetical protein
MDLSKDVGERDQLVRTVLAVVLAVVAIRSLRKGKRLNGALAGVSALALGYTATTGSDELTETLGIDTTGEDRELRCSACGQPILPGQRRGPNANDEIVHEACKVPAG